MSNKNKKPRATAFTDLLLLPDGRILVQNLTRPMARLLHRLNPGDDAIARRAKITADHS